MPVREGTSHAGDRIADLLSAARTARLTGRTPELEAFRAALQVEGNTAAVWYVHGPGGIGKTTLLREFAAMAHASGRPVIHVDARDLQPSRQALLGALAQTLDRPASADGCDVGFPERGVLILDTYELLRGLDGWIRETLLPGLAASALVVIAGREAPALAWRTDVAWATLLREVALGEFSNAESIAFLSARGVAAQAHAEILRFAHGHPLALALVADVLAKRPERMRFEPSAAPDVVRHLLELFLQDVPVGRERDALEVCAIARVTTEPLLVELFGPEDGRRAFAWLRTQPFVESGSLGLFPHDLAREVLLADAQWRDPEQVQRRSRLIFVYVHHRIARAHGSERERLQLDALFVTRINRTNREFFDWQAMQDLRTEPARAQDAEWIVALVNRFEGGQAAALARSWLAAQARAFRVFYDASDQRFGFLALLDIGANAVSSVDDPAVRAATSFMEQHAPLGAGESAVYLRWWMHADHYQAVTAAINVTAGYVVAHCVTRAALAWSFVAMADPAFWTEHFAGVNFVRAPAADFVLDGRSYGVFAHEWRIEPPADWMMAIRSPMPFAQQPATGPPTRLDRAQFRSAVKAALRDYARADQLAANPLTSTQLAGRETASTARVAALQARLREAAEALQSNPKDVKLYRALLHTYFEPLPTQERVAERLGLPFSTYRHHLARGIERVDAWLWQCERALPRA